MLLARAPRRVLTLPFAALNTRGMSLRCRRGLSLVVAGLFATALSGCAGPYRDLESSFKSGAGSGGVKIWVKSVVLSSTRHEGAHNYGGTSLSVRLTTDAMELDPKFPLDLYMAAVRIPAKDVSGCTCSSFGSDAFTANLLIERTGTEISFEQSKDVFEWCRQNRLPIISGNDSRNWLYSHGALPDKSKFSEQFSSRERFDRQLKSSCAGD